MAASRHSAIWSARWRLLRGLVLSFMPATGARKLQRIWGAAYFAWYDLEDFRAPAELKREFPQRLWS